MLTVKQSVVMRRNKLDIILATDKNHGGKKAGKQSYIF